jgi:lipid II:glycine glycyltransferase (peptidoglycan interpeptide bridge formation enzyme)
VNNDFRIIENLDARAWDDFVASRGGHVLQSIAWGELKSRFGWNAHRLALICDEAMVAGAQILFRRLPLGLQFAYIPRGPVVDFNDHPAVDAILDVVKRFAKSRGAFALKIEPNSLNLKLETWNLKPATCIQPRTTIHLDLTRNLDTILAQMKSKWRYNIRLAERKGIVVRAGNADDLPAFYRLMQITSARDQFAIHSADYYRAAFELFTARDYARLFVAEYAGEPLAMIFVTAFGGEAIYLYGASSNAHRERMPNHALHWSAIQWAKTRGCARYDLWGVAAVADALVNHPEQSREAAESKDEPLPHGLYQFKQGFGGQLVQYAGGYDAVFSRWQYAVYELAVKVKRGGIG